MAKHIPHKGPDVFAKHDNGAQRCGCVHQNRKRQIFFFQPEKGLARRQMSRAGDRQKFSETLKQAEQEIGECFQFNSS